MTFIEWIDQCIDTEEKEYKAYAASISKVSYKSMRFDRNRRNKSHKTINKFKTLKKFNLANCVLTDDIEYDLCHIFTTYLNPTKMQELNITDNYMWTSGYNRENTKEKLYAILVSDHKKLQNKFKKYEKNLLNNNVIS